MSALVAALLGLLGALPDPSAGLAGAPHLSWLSIDAGGGPVASGELHGFVTFGQADSWAASGGGYRLTGGFLAALPSLPFFADGFESGTTGAWSTSFGDPDLPPPDPD
jgi:hypothetical protein